MLVLHPWSAERQGARTSEELTEREPTPLTTSAGERPKQTQEEVTELYKGQEDHCQTCYFLSQNLPESARK